MKMKMNLTLRSVMAWAMVMMMLLSMMMIGCGHREYAMKRTADMVLLPATANLPDKATLAACPHNRINRGAEGIGGSVFSAAYFGKDGQVVKFNMFNPGLANGQFSAENLYGFVPLTPKEMEGGYVIPFNRSGTLAFNSKGEEMRIDPSKKLTWAEIKETGFFQPVFSGSPFVKEISRDEAKELLRPIVKTTWDATNKYMAKHPEMKQGITETLEEYQQRVKNDSTLEKLWKELLGENWYVILTYPLSSPETAGLSVLVTKCFAVNVSMFTEKYDSLGHDEYMPNAGDTAAIAEIVAGGVVSEYFKAQPPVSNMSLGLAAPLPDAILNQPLIKELEKILGRPIVTYGDYNEAVVKYNGQ